MLPSQNSPGVPMRRGLRLDLASVTKVASTTVAVMRLIAERQIRLDDTVRSFLPLFSGDGKEAITVRQLLTHTAGMRQWWPLYLESTQREETIERVQRLSLAAQPGDAWSYSDLGLMLAGAVVERVTTHCLADAYRILVAEPIGLTSTYGPVAADTAVTSADSDVYEQRMVETGIPYPVPFVADEFLGWRGHPLRGEVNDGNTAHALGGVSGHAGLFSTVDDLLALGAAIRGGNFIPRRVVHAFAESTSLRSDQAVGFRCTTVNVDGDPITILHHGGFTGACFGFALEKEVVVAGGVMRLYGTVGQLSRHGPLTPLPQLVTVDHIQKILLATAADALRTEPTRATTLPEDV
ncbi:serine hydrolase domain-containing protein [Rathayibacter soli]|uniref:serine hydrolase domain-containing protein n=1 Tax=Rathayibacter soli TaxID=3144168 RepID=UPI0027E42231|nr:serine hydrolase domain-containing protein [Glaciibacter superstes]